MKKTIALLQLPMLLTALSVQALDKTFTYQGVLNNGAQPVLDGLYDLSFKLYEHEQNNTPPNPGVSSHPATPVTNGVFTVKLSFPNAPFDGRNYWLEISAKTNGAASFVTLAPRQMITPTPYSLYAVSAGGLSGTLPATQLPANVALLDRNQTFTAEQAFMRNVGIGTPSPANKLHIDLNSATFTGLGIDDSYGLLRLAGPDDSYYLRARGKSAFAPFDYFTVFIVKSDGSVGIGAPTPEARLHVQKPPTGVGVFVGNRSPFGFSAFESDFDTPTTHAWFAENGNRVFSVTGGGNGFFAGNVGIGTTTPQAKLAIAGDIRAESFSTVPVHAVVTHSLGLIDGVLSETATSLNSGAGYFSSLYKARFSQGASGLAFSVMNGDDSSESNRKAWINSAGEGFFGGNVSVCSLTIRGGCDLAEPFEMSGKEIPKGAVVVIDENNPGHLRMSDRACDTRVAGIVSGANGVNTGVVLSQESVLDSGQNVALSGRVFVQADASSAPIKPGDLLTTSDVPGHAMKVTDHAKAQGAILGKAMTSLPEGKGMVLVLVTLQ